MRNKLLSLIIAVLMAVTVLPFTADTAEAATKLTDKSVYYVTGYIGGDCLLTANNYMMRRASILRGSTKWQGLNNTSVPLRSALCVGSSRYSNCLLYSYSYTYDGLTFKGKRKGLSGSKSSKIRKLKSMLDKHPEGVAVWASNAGKGYPHAVLLTGYKGNTFYCADSTHNASKYRKKGKNRGVEPFSTCTVSSISRISAYWYLEKVTGVAESKPITITNDSATGKPIVKWNRVIGAKKYKVQRKLMSENNYKTIATVTKKTYTDKKAVATKKYHYRIKSYNSKGKCIFTSAPKSRSCDLARPEITKVNNIASTGAVEITFKGVKSANKYVIYRTTNTKQTYSEYKTINCEINSGDELHSVLCETGTLGKKYYYKIRSFYTKNDNATSALSKYRSGIRKLAAPEISVQTADTGEITVSWNEVANVTSYEVYRATSEEGEYELVSTVEGMSYTEPEIPAAGIKYYYKVKALYKDNANADSAFSIIKSNIEEIVDEPVQDSTEGIETEGTEPETDIPAENN